MNRFIFCFCLLLVLVRGSYAGQPPNIVLILADDLAWADLGCYGHAWHRTPNLDRLADEGLRFTQAYAPAPICSASRASILTGKAVARLGFEFVTKDQPGRQQLDATVPLQSPAFTLNLPLHETTVAECLSWAGYETAFFGKWHVSQHYQRYLGWHPNFGPNAQGFQIADEDFGDHPYAWDKKQKPEPLPAGVFPEDSMIDRVADHITRDKPNQQPFFVMASLFYVHTPVKNRCEWLVRDYDSIVPTEVPNRNKRVQYAAFLETLDHHVGTILSAIDAAGIGDDTMVVFLSDNGGHPAFTANGPLRGSKWNLYEGGIRVPMLIRWPGTVKPGARTETPVIGYDLLPTLHEIASVTGEGVSVDGVSLVPLLTDTDWQPERSLNWHFPYYHPESGFRDAGETIGVNDFHVSKTRPHSAMRLGRYKILRFAEDRRTEVYDLDADVAEQNDLSTKNPKLARELANQLEVDLARFNARRAQPIP